VNVPAPLIDKFPATVRFVLALAVIPLPVIVKLLKLFVLLPEIIAFVPLKVTVLVLPVNVPSFVQLPATEWENELPLNAVPLPMDTLPFMVIAFAALAEAVPDIVKFPAIVIAVPGIVFVPLLLKVRLP
jgi:hypothetical protein